MTYGSFALLYDELMRDVPYEQWVEFIKRQKDLDTDSAMTYNTIK